MSYSSATLTTAFGNIRGATQAAKNAAALESRNAANLAIEQYVAAGGTWAATAGTGAATQILSTATDGTGMGINVAGQRVTFTLNTDPLNTVGVHYGTVSNRYCVENGAGYDVTATAANVTSTAAGGADVAQ